MVRETRHLWVGNLPENISEDRIRDHFKRYGPVQSVKVLSGGSSGGSGSGTSVNVSDEVSGGGAGGNGGAATGGGSVCATVAFVDICSAAKAHKVDHRLDERILKTTYYEPQLSAQSVASTHYAAVSSQQHLHRGDHYSSAPPQSPQSLGSRSPRFTSSVNEDHNGYERSSHFYENRRDDQVSYNGPVSVGNSTGSNSSLAVRRAYPTDREPDFAGGRGRVRSYPRNTYCSVGRGEPSEYRWVGTQYRYHQDPFVEEKIAATRRCTGPSSPPTTRVGRPSRATTDPKRRDPPDARSGSESPSSSHSSASSSSSSSSSSGSSSSRSPSPRGSSRSTSRSPRRIGGPSLSMGGPAMFNSSLEKRPLAICIRNLPPWSTESSLKDGLFHDYKKHGKITTVRILGSGNDRYAIVCFKKPQDAEKALDASHEKQFFGLKIQVAPHEGLELDESEYRAYDVEQDEYHHKATRTLFIGNLEKDINATELRKHFDTFGEIIEIDIKKQNSSTFAFCQYSDIRSVVKAMRKMDGEYLGANRIKLGFGKSMPTRCVWIDGIADNVTEGHVGEQFYRFGPVTHINIDRGKGHALISYESEKYAIAAVNESRGRVMNGKKIQIDFASRECQAAFFDHLTKQGFPVPSDRPWERREATEKEPAARFEAAPTRFSRYDRARRDGTFPARTTTPAQRATTATYNSSSSRSRGRSYDEYSQGSGASYEDSYERELREYAGSQRYEGGTGTTPTTTRRPSYSPARKREERSSPSPRSHSRENGSASPIARQNYDDYETASRKSGRPRSNSDRDSFHSPSPPGSRAASPPNSKTSGRARSPGTPIATSPSREVTLLDDRTLADPRRRRPSGLKDLVVRVRPMDSPVRSNCKMSSKGHPDLDADELGFNSIGMRNEPQDPRLHKRLEDPVSSGDERSTDSDRMSKKLHYVDYSYDKVVKRLPESEDRNRDTSPSFRRPYDSRKPGDKNRRDCPNRFEDPIRSPRPDPRNRKQITGGSDLDELNHWRLRDQPPMSSSCDSGDFGSDGSAPGTPVRDERDEPSSLNEHSRHLGLHHSSNTNHYPVKEKVPLSLPLPKFASQTRHVSTWQSSLSPKNLSFMRSPPFNCVNTSATWSNNNETTAKEEEEEDPSLAETPMSPGPAIHENISDDEESPANSPSGLIDIDERIKALDEKYEKWNGTSRSIAGSTSAGMGLRDSQTGNATHNSRKKRILDIEELCSRPSAIFKTMLSKRSIFDEDSERLENVSDKYEPKPFASVARTRGSTIVLNPLTSISASTSSMPTTTSIVIPTTTAPVPSATPIGCLPGVRSSEIGPTISGAEPPKPSVSRPSERSQEDTQIHSSTHSLISSNVPSSYNDTVASSKPKSTNNFSWSSESMLPSITSGSLTTQPFLSSPISSPSLSPVCTVDSSIPPSFDTKASEDRNIGNKSVRSMECEPSSVDLIPKNVQSTDHGGTKVSEAVVTVVADTSVTGVVSVTQTVSSSKAVLTATQAIPDSLPAVISSNYSLENAERTRSSDSREKEETTGGTSSTSISIIRNNDQSFVPETPVTADEAQSSAKSAFNSRLSQTKAKENLAEKDNLVNNVNYIPSKINSNKCDSKSSQKGIQSDISASGDTPENQIQPHNNQKRKVSESETSDLKYKALREANIAPVKSGRKEEPDSKKIRTHSEDQSHANSTVKERRNSKDSKKVEKKHRNNCNSKVDADENQKHNSTNRVFNCTKEGTTQEKSEIVQKIYEDISSNRLKEKSHNIKERRSSKDSRKNDKKHRNNSKDSISALQNILYAEDRIKTLLPECMKENPELLGKLSDRISDHLKEKYGDKFNTKLLCDVRNILDFDRNKNEHDGRYLVEHVKLENNMEDIYSNSKLIMDAFEKEYITLKNESKNSLKLENNYNEYIKENIKIKEESDQYSSDKKDFKVYNEVFETRDHSTAEKDHSIKSEPKEKVEIKEKEHRNSSHLDLEEQKSPHYKEEIKEYKLCKKEQKEREFGSNSGTSSSSRKEDKKDKDRQRDHNKEKKNHKYDKKASREEKQIKEEVNEATSEKYSFNYEDNYSRHSKSQEDKESFCSDKNYIRPDTHEPRKDKKERRDKNREKSRDQKRDKSKEERKERIKTETSEKSEDQSNPEFNKHPVEEFKPSKREEKQHRKSDEFREFKSENKEYRHKKEWNTEDESDKEEKKEKSRNKKYESDRKETKREKAETDRKEEKVSSSGKVAKIKSDHEKRRHSEDSKCREEKRERHKDKKNRVRERHKSANSTKSEPEKERSKDKDKSKSSECSRDKNRDKSKHFKESTKSEQNQYQTNVERDSLSEVASNHNRLKFDNEHFNRYKLSHGELPDVKNKPLLQDISDDDMEISLPKYSTTEFVNEEKNDSPRKKHVSGRTEKAEEHRSKSKISKTNKRKSFQDEEQEMQAKTPDKSASSDEEIPSRIEQPAKRCKQRATSSSSGSRRGRPPKNSILDTDSDCSESKSESDGETGTPKDSYFDVPVYEGCYDMYDKVKARRFKLQQKQQEERNKQEAAQKLLQHYRLQQNRKKQKKNNISRTSTAISQSDDSGTEVETKRTQGGQIVDSSSDEETVKQRRSHFSDSDSSNQETKLSTSKSSNSRLKEPEKSKSRFVLPISDITSDEEDFGRHISHGRTLISDSDSEPVQIQSNLSNKIDSDSEVSEAGITKPPRPSLSAGINKPQRTKEKKSSKYRNKGNKDHGKQVFNNSNDTSNWEDTRHTKPKLKAIATEIKTSSSQPSYPRINTSEKKRHPDPITKERRKEGKLEAIFGHMSDDSDSSASPTASRGASRIILAPSRRNLSTSSSGSPAQHLLSSPDNQNFINDRYDSELEDHDSRDFGMEEHIKSEPVIKDLVSKNNNNNLTDMDIKSESKMKHEAIEIDSKQTLDPPLEGIKHLETDVCRIVSDSGKGSSVRSSSGVSSSSSCSGSSAEEIMHLELSSKNNTAIPDEFNRARIKDEIYNKDVISNIIPNEVIPHKDKKKKKNKKDKDKDRSRSKDHHKSSKAMIDTQSLHNTSESKQREPREEKVKMQKPPSPPPLPITMASLPSSPVPEPVEETKEEESPLLDMPLIKPEETEIEKPPTPQLEKVEPMDTKDAKGSPDMPSVEMKEPFAEDVKPVEDPYNEETSAPSQATSSKASRAVISQEETLNAVAGLLACYDDYAEDTQPPEQAQDEEESLLSAEAPTTTEDVSEEAQKAAQLLQSEMPGVERESEDREDTWAVVESGAPMPSLQERDSEEQTPSIQFTDSPSSVQSEPALQIDEDVPDITEVPEDSTPVIYSPEKKMDVTPAEEPVLKSPVKIPTRPTWSSPPKEKIEEVENKPEFSPIAILEEKAEENKMETEISEITQSKTEEQRPPPSLFPELKEQDQDEEEEMEVTPIPIEEKKENIIEEISKEVPDKTLDIPILVSTAKIPEKETMDDVKVDQPTEEVDEPKSNVMEMETETISELETKNRTEFKDIKTQDETEKENLELNKELSTPTLPHEPPKVEKASEQIESSLPATETLKGDEDSKLAELELKSDKKTEPVKMEDTLIETEKESLKPQIEKDSTPVIVEEPMPVKEDEEVEAEREEEDAKIDLDAEDLSEKVDKDEQAIETMDMPDLEEDIPSVSPRGRGRGRLRSGKRGIKRNIDLVSTEKSEAKLMATRTTCSTRATKGRGRGRVTRISESEDKPMVLDTPPEPRRSARTKRIRRHPDMVDHDETTNRRKRGGGRGKLNHPLDEQSSQFSMVSSSVYDFHDSDDDSENYNIALSKSKAKKEPAQPTKNTTNAPLDIKPPISPIKTITIKQSDLDMDDGKTAISSVITRKSKRLLVKPPEEEDNSLDSPAPPLTRGRGRNKLKDFDVEDEVSIRKSPRRGARPTSECESEPEKVVETQPAVPVVSTPATSSVLVSSLPKFITTSTVIIPTTSPVTNIKSAIEVKPPVITVENPPEPTVTEVKPEVEEVKEESTIKEIKIIPPTPPVTTSIPPVISSPTTVVATTSTPPVSISTTLSTVPVQVSVPVPVSLPVHIQSPASVAPPTVTLNPSIVSEPRPVIITSTKSVVKALPIATTAISSTGKPLIMIEAEPRPTPLVDPVTGLLTPMKMEEGQYVPIGSEMQMNALLVSNQDPNAPKLTVAKIPAIAISKPNHIVSSAGIMPSKIVHLKQHTAQPGKQKILAGLPQRRPRVPAVLSATLVSGVTTVSTSNVARLVNVSSGHLIPSTVPSIATNHMSEVSVELVPRPRISTASTQPSTRVIPNPLVTNTRPTNPVQVTAVRASQANIARMAVPVCRMPTRPTVTSNVQMSVARPTVVAAPVTSLRPTIPTQMTHGLVGVSLAGPIPRAALTVQQKAPLPPQQITRVVCPANSPKISLPVSIDQIPAVITQGTRRSSSSGVPYHISTAPPQMTVTPARMAVATARTTASGMSSPPGRSLPATIVTTATTEEAARVSAAYPADERRAVRPDYGVHYDRAQSPHIPAIHALDVHGSAAPSHLVAAANAAAVKGRPVSFYTRTDRPEGGANTPVHAATERFIATPPLHSPSPAGTPPPAHQNSNQGEMIRVGPQLTAPRSIYGAYYAQDPRSVFVSGEKVPITPLALDMKVEKNLLDKAELEKLEAVGNGASRTQTVLAAAAAASHGQSSPHLLASPQPYERASDSPQVSIVARPGVDQKQLVYGHRFPPLDRAFYPNRSGTPGAEHEALAHSPVAHVYSGMPPSDSPQRTVRIPPPQYASPVPPLPHAPGGETSLLTENYPPMWTGGLVLKNTTAMMTMHFVSGSFNVAKYALPNGHEPIRIGQRMRLEHQQLDGVARKMTMSDEHCMLVSLPYARSAHEYQLQQTNINQGFIKYLGDKQAAGIVNVPNYQQPMYVMHIFPPCDFVNDSMARIAPELHRSLQDISHLLIVIATC